MASRIVKPVTITATIVAVAIGFSAAPAKAQNAYITNGGSSSVSVIDTTTNKVVGSPIALSGGEPFGVAVTPDGGKVYVGEPTTDTMSVIDTATNKVTRLTFGFNDEPAAVALTPDGRSAYVVTGNSVAVIDTATDHVVGRIGVGLKPIGLAVTSDGRKVYVANQDSGSVSVIDTSTNTVIGSAITVGRAPRGVAGTPDGRKVYVTDYGANTVSVIDTAIDKVVGSPIAVGIEPWGVAVTPDGHTVYVANHHDNSISLIDTATDKVVGSPIAVGRGPVGVAVTPNGREVYVANFFSDTVSVIDTTTNTVVGSPIPVGRAPFAFGVFIRPTILVSPLSAALIIRESGQNAGFTLDAVFGAGVGGFFPPADPLTLGIGPYTATLPAGSLRRVANPPFYLFEGTIKNVRLVINVLPLGGSAYEFSASGTPVNLTAVPNPVAISFSIGNHLGSATVNATRIR